MEDLIRGLRRADKEAAKKLRRTQRPLAKKVSDRARQVAAGQSRAYAKAKNAITPFVDSRGTGGVSLSKRRYPWVFGSEFGSFVYKQFPLWRGNKQNAGYAMFPTARKMGPVIADEMADAVVSAVRETIGDS